MSFSFRADVSGLERAVRDTPRNVSRFLDEEAEGMVTDIKLSFGSSPSSPGDPPGVDTGALRAGIGWEADGDFTRIIHDGVEYGVHLEFGTSRMAARPWMGPAFERERERLPDALRNAGLEG